MMTGNRRSGFLRAAAVCLALSLLALPLSQLRASALAPDAPGRIMLSFAGDGALALTWVDAEGVGDGRVRYGLSPDLSDAREAKALPAPGSSAIEAGGSRFTAELAGLAPGATYYYSVGGAGGWSATQSFMAADTGAADFSFLYFGDIQVTEGAESDFAAWGALAGGAYARNPGAAFALQGGDIVESGIDTGQWDAFLDSATPVFSRIPFMPTNGNHESNFPSGKPELYLDVFSLPRNGPEGFEEEFYSFDYGDAHFTVLNSWVFSGEQRLDEDDLEAIDAWVERDLSSSAATWKIAVTHLPLYAVHSDAVADATRAHWAPLFERHGVALALVGHQHVYSRLKPLSGGAVDFERGVTYIMGNSGRKFYDSADERLAERMIYGVSTYQSIRIDGNMLTVQTFDGEGRELDLAAISPRADEAPAVSDWTLGVMARNHRDSDRRGQRDRAGQRPRIVPKRASS
ncbi:MAG: metallophosphoesterase family protein [Clostridiales Family XIII bacterium]|jgi:hypothetical protein|nr:metallophosphoesterase family protein [Clostridiales Family XIII bacterium]